MPWSFKETDDWRDRILDKVRGQPVPSRFVATVTGDYARILAGMTNVTDIPPSYWMYRQMAMHIATRTGQPYLRVLAELNPRDGLQGVNATLCPHPGCTGEHLLH